MAEKPTYEELEKRVLELDKAELEQKRSQDAHRDSEERYRLVMEASPDPIVVYDMEGNAIYINPAFTRVFGWTYEEVAKRKIDYVPKAAWPETQAMLERLQRGESYFGFETQRYDKNRQILDISMNFAVWKDHYGKPAGAVVILRDITEQKKAQEALLREAQINQAVAQLSRDLLSPASIDEISFLVLEQAKHLTRSTFGFVGYIDPETSCLVCPTLTRDIWDTCQVPDKNIVFTKFTGLWGWVLENRRPLMTNAAVDDPRSSGTPPGHIPVRRFLSAPALIGESIVGQVAVANSDYDYSDSDLGVVERLANLYEIAIQRQRTEEELKKHRDRLEELVKERTTELSTAKERAEAAQISAEAANRFKSDFLARMSHEIRTPLNAVTGLTNIVLKSELTGKQRDYLNKVQIASNNLLTVINDILDFSKVEAGRLDLEPHPIELERLMEQLADLFCDRVAQKGLKLHFVVAPQVPRHLIGDAGRLTQVLTNLIGNAIKFTDQGGIIVRVDLDDAASEEHTRTTLQLTVSDTGVGIAADVLPTLFDPFVQVDGSLSRRHDGTGLGLAICKQLAELMDGRIWAESTPGKGSTFSFTAVLETPMEPTEAVVSDYIQAPSALPVKRLAGRRVLVVEDSELNLIVAMTLLEEMGLIVETAENGKVAVEKLTRSEPGYYNSVLMDIQMPEMDGYEATRHIREWEAEAHATGGPSATNDQRVPIIALTANALKGEKEKCLAANMNDYLSKPLDEKDLQRALIKWMYCPKEDVDNSDRL